MYTLASQWASFQELMSQKNVRHQSLIDKGRLYSRRVQLCPKLVHTTGFHRKKKGEEKKTKQTDRQTNQSLHPKFFSAPFLPDGDQSCLPFCGRRTPFSRRLCGLDVSNEIKLRLHLHAPKRKHYFPPALRQLSFSRGFPHRLFFLVL